MTESKTTKAKLPAADEPPFDAPADDPLFEDAAAPGPSEAAALPEQPEAEEAVEPAKDAAPLQVVEAVPAEPAPEAIEPADTALEPDPAEEIFEPEAAAAAVEVAPEPEIEPEVETDEVAETAAREAIDEPHPDIFGPEPWEQAPAPLPATHAGAWADVGPAREAPEAELAPDAAPEAAPALSRPAPEEATLEVKRTAFAIYFQYLSALMVIGVPLLPFACWLAYKRKEDAPEWLRSHYIYQIRTFWISMAGIGFAVLAAPLPFGLFSPTIVAVVVWLTIRCFFGLVRLHRSEPIFNPQTWIV
jgi:uncharacterized membrane protein